MSETIEYLPERGNMSALPSHASEKESKRPDRALQKKMTEFEYCQMYKEMFYYNIAINQI